jgi:hypothetical protein
VQPVMVLEKTLEELTHPRGVLHQINHNLPFLQKYQKKYAMLFYHDFQVYDISLFLIHKSQENDVWYFFIFDS